MHIHFVLKNKGKYNLGLKLYRAIHLTGSVYIFPGRINLYYGFPLLSCLLNHGRSQIKKILRIAATIGRDILIKGEFEFINGN